MLLRIVSNIIKFTNNSPICNEQIKSKFAFRLFCDSKSAPISEITKSTVQTSGASENEQSDSKNVPNENNNKVVLIDKDGPITIISLNRPEYRNAINIQMAHDLCDAITDFENDETAKVGVLCGIGGSFSSGYDMKELQLNNIKPEILLQMEGTVGPTRRILRKPMVCGISGYCVANGLELAIMCDLRVMEEDAILGFYNRRFGVPLLDGGTIRLPVLIGLSRALDLILTGRTVNAKEALEIGLVNRIVATGTALGQAVNLAYSLSKFPQAALNHDRKSAYTSAFESSTFDTAAFKEMMSVSQDVIDEMVHGAELFNNGIGRSGTTENIKEKIMTDWEFEEYKKEKNYKKIKYIKK